MSLAQGRVLVVEPESEVRGGVVSILETQGASCVSVGSRAEALEAVRGSRFDVILIDPKMPGHAGNNLVRSLREANPEALVVVTSAYATVDAAAEAIRLGVFDYLAKPVRSEELILVVKRAFERIGERVPDDEPDDNGFAGIIGSAPRMREIFEIIRRVANASATVLIEGESGTGKELVARALHERSRRRAFPFISVHCSALPGSLLESELFGHEKGAFTGAIRMQKGKFELADRGTLLLDEIATLDMRAQIDLLRVLQEREFTRIGGTELIRTDARVIATTNEPLADLVRDGRLREDLYYRLNVVRIELPPLRERENDVELLARHFLAKYGERNDRAVSEFEPSALDCLCRWHWPGNVRELENVIEQAVVLGTGSRIGLNDLPRDLRGDGDLCVAPPAGSEPALGDGDLQLTPRLSALERLLILRALEACGGNRLKAAEQLDISERALRYKIRKHAIPVGSE